MRPHLCNAFRKGDGPFRRICNHDDYFIRAFFFFGYHLHKPPTQLFKFISTLTRVKFTNAGRDSASFRWRNEGYFFLRVHRFRYFALLWKIFDIYQSEGLRRRGKGHWFFGAILTILYIFCRCVNITDIGLGYLSTMPCMQILFLRWCSQIRDGGVQHLSTMRSLRVLSLAGTYSINIVPMLRNQPVTPRAEARGLTFRFLF